MMNGAPFPMRGHFTNSTICSSRLGMDLRALMTITPAQLVGVSPLKSVSPCYSFMRGMIHGFLQSRMTHFGKHVDRTSKSLQRMTADMLASTREITMTRGMIVVWGRLLTRYAHLAPEYQNRAVVALNRYGHDWGTAGLKPSGEFSQKKQNPLASQGVAMVEPRGIEPLTSTLRT